MVQDTLDKIISDFNINIGPIVDIITNVSQTKNSRDSILFR